MTALDITYEDGLRLSELMGRLSSLQYQHDHFWNLNIDLAVVVSMILVTIGCVIFWMREITAAINGLGYLF